MIRGEPGDFDNGLEPGALIITQGSRLVADGLPDEPIVFTSTTDNGTLTRHDNGLWGGLIILGNAQISTPPGTLNHLKLPDDDLARYGEDLAGATNDADDSGILRYVSIRHGGAMFQAGTPAHGLQLAGVGAGSVIDFVEVFACSRDGFSFLGGTVGTKHLVSIFSGDEAFDGDEGYRGNGQFWFALHETTPESNRFGEYAGGTNDNRDAAPFAIPTVYNSTFIGFGPGSGGPEYSLNFRDNAGGIFRNSIFSESGGAAISVEDVADRVDSRDRLDAGDLDLRNNLWWNFGAGTDAASLTSANFVEVLFDEAARENNIQDPQFTGLNRDPGAQGFDPRPSAGSPALTNARFPLPGADPFFMTADFIGAFDAQGDWTEGWTRFYQDEHSVDVPDEGLRGAIMDAVGKSSGVLTVGDLESLVHLDANNHGIVDLTGIELAVNLERLYLNNNCLIDIGLIGGLSSLQALDLTANFIDDLGPLGGLNILSELHAALNRITDLSALSGLTGLSILSLQNNGINDPGALAGLNSLTELNLAANSIFDLTDLGGLVSLVHLNLTGNLIEDISPLVGLAGSIGDLFLDGNYLQFATLVSQMEEVRGAAPEDLSFDAFVIGSAPSSSADPDAQAVAFFDNLSYTVNPGTPEQRAETFDAGVGSLDTALGADTEGFDLGFSDTNLAGGDPGEIGGVIARTDNAFGHHLADLNIGAVSRLDRLEVSGAFVISEDRGFNGLIHAGYVNTASASANPIDRAQNQVGMSFVEPNDGSGRFRVTGFSNLPGEGRARGNNLLIGVGEPTGFNFVFDPSGAGDGTGTATLTLMRAVDDTQDQVVAALVAGGAGVSGADQREFHGFADPGLDGAVRDALGLGPSDPLTLADVQGLTDLDARERGIQDIRGIEALRGLTNLILRDNAIEDVGPLGELGGLQQLDLKGNEVHDINPLGSLAALRRLYLDFNNIHDIWGLHTLSGLQTLDLSYNNKITDISAISYMRKLEELYLGGNWVVDLWPLSGLSYLRYFDVHTNGVEDLEPLRDLTSLHSLNIESNRITNIDALENLGWLDSLYIGGNAVWDISVVSVLGALREFNARNNAIYDVGPLAGLPNLTYLQLEGNLIEDISPLAGAAQLHDLNLERNFLDVIVKEFRHYEDRSPAGEDFSFDTFVVGGSPEFTSDPNSQVEAFFDNLTYTVENSGNLEERSETFDTDAGFFTASVGAATEGFGLDFSNSGNATENGGEIGGLFAFTDNAEHYVGDPGISGVSRLDRLEFSGSMVITQDLNFVARFFVGYINSGTAAADPISESQNELGIEILDGFRMRPLSNAKSLGRSNGGQLDVGVGEVVAFSFLYEPSGEGDGNGVMTAAFQVGANTANDDALAGLRASGVNVRANDQREFAGFFDASLEGAVRDALGFGPNDPVTLGDVQGLTDLDGSGRGITDLAGIEALRALTNLHLRDNEIEDVGPVGELGGLQQLDLGGNQIRDINPLGSLAALRRLYLDHNNIHDIWGLHTLSGLQALNLSNNDKITDIQALSYMRKLEELYLGGNWVVDLWPLSGLGYLRYLEVQNNGVEDLEPLRDLTSLHALNIESNRITNIDALENLGSLDSLHIGGNAIRDISVVAALGALRDFNTRDNAIADLGPLAGLANLMYLQLQGNLIEDISPLAGLAQLHDVNLERNFLDVNVKEFRHYEDRSPAGEDFSFDTFVVGGSPEFTSDPNSQVEAFFDNLTYTVENSGNLEERSETFDTDAGFFTASVGAATEGFGLDFSNSGNATGNGGEIGGLFAFTDNAEHYVGDPAISGVSRLDRLEFSGSMVITQDLNFVARFFVGYINSGTAAADPISESQNELGIEILDGFRMRPLSNAKSLGRSNGGQLDVGVGEVVAFSFLYEPSGDGDGNGVMTAAFQVGPNTASDDAISNLRAAGANIHANDQREFTGFADGNLEAAVRDALGLGASDPLTLGDVQGLTDLDGNGRGITDLAGIEALRALTNLHLRDNALEDLGAIGELGGLQQLDLGGNQLHDVNPLGSLAALRRLYLDYNNIHDIWGLHTLNGLQALNLSYNYNIGDIHAISYMRKLEELYLGGNFIDDISPLAGLTYLNHLELQDNRIREIGVLSGLGNLGFVDLRENFLVITPGTAARAVVDELIGEGVEVHFEPQNDFFAELRLLDDLKEALQPIWGPVDNQNSGVLDLVETPLGLSYTQNAPAAFLGVILPFKGYASVDRDWRAEVMVHIDALALPSRAGGGPNFESFALGFHLTHNSDPSDFLFLNARRDYNTDGSTVSFDEPVVVLGRFTDGGYDGDLGRFEHAGSDVQLQIEWDAEAGELASFVVLEDGSIWEVIRVDLRDRWGLLPDGTMTLAIEGFSNTDLTVTAEEAYMMNFRADGLVPLLDVALADDLKDGLGPNFGPIESDDASIIDLISGTDGLSVVHFNVQDLDDGTKVTTDYRAVAPFERDWQAEVTVTLPNDTASIGLPTGSGPFNSESIFFELDLINSRNRDQFLFFEYGHTSFEDGAGGVFHNRQIARGDAGAEVEEGIFFSRNLEQPEVLLRVTWDAHRAQLILSYETGGFLYDMGTVNPASRWAMAFGDTFELRLAGFSQANNLDLPPGEVVGMNFSTSPLTLFDEPVQISDPGLLAAFSDSTGVPDVDLTIGDLLGVDVLDASGYGISDLSGLEEARFLRELYLDKNQISDLWPVANLVHLEILSLNINHIRDLGPLGGLHSLQVLNVNLNQIEYLDPLSNLNLRTLRLNGNLISDLGPVSSLHSLSFLSLNDNRISNLWPLQTLENLNTLFLNDNEVADLGALGSLETLRSLFARRNRIEHLESLSGLPELIQLRVSGNQIVEFSPVLDLPALTNLELFDNPISDFSPLSQLPDLVALRLGETTFDDLSLIAAAPNLNTLIVRETPIADFSPLAGFVSLEVFVAHDTSFDDLTPLAGRDLDTLGIRNTPMADFTGLAAFTTLRQLNVSGTGFNDLTLLNGMAGLTLLRVADTPIADFTLLPTLTTLEFLDLSGTSFADLNALQNLPNLVTLFLSRMAIGDFSPLAALAGLERLFLDENGLADVSFLAGLGNLGVVTLNGNQLTDLSPLTDRTSLFFLQARQNLLTDLDVLATLPCLTNLDLRYNFVDLSPGTPAGDLVNGFVELNRTVLARPQFDPNRALMDDLKADLEAIWNDLVNPAPGAVDLVEDVLGLSHVQTAPASFVSVDLPFDGIAPFDSSWEVSVDVQLPVPNLGFPTRGGAPTSEAVDLGFEVHSPYNPGHLGFFEAGYSFQDDGSGSFATFRRVFQGAIGGNGFTLGPNTFVDASTVKLVIIWDAVTRLLYQVAYADGELLEFNTIDPVAEWGLGEGDFFLLFLQSFVDTDLAVGAGEFYMCNFEASGIVFSSAVTVDLTVETGAAPDALQWRVDGRDWQPSGATVDNVPVGEATIEYRPTLGLAPLPPDTITVERGQLTTLTTDFSTIRTFGECDPDFSRPEFKRHGFPSRIIPDGSWGLLVSWGGILNSAFQRSGAVIRLREADAAHDPSFFLGPQLSFATATAVEADGEILIAGFLESDLRGIGEPTRVIRAYTDGSLDPGFQAPHLRGGSVRMITIQPDGKILLGGLFDRVGDNAVTGLVRLNTDGTLDQSFNIPILDDLEGISGTGIWAPIVLDGGGNIYIGGRFGAVNGAARQGFARLLPDGSLDDAFSAGGYTIAEGRPVRGIGITSDDKVIIGGLFNADATGEESLLLRLNADGAFDDTFTLLARGDAALDNQVRQLAVLPDDTIVAVDSTVARYLPDGALDDTFHRPVFDHENGQGFGTAFWLAPADAGTLLIAGGRSLAEVDGVAVPGIARLNADGTLDNTFLPPDLQQEIYPSNIALQSDGFPVVWDGRFSLVNGIPLPALARFDLQGAADDTLDLSGSIVDFRGLIRAGLTSDDRIYYLASVGPDTANAENVIGRLISNGDPDDSFAESPVVGNGLFVPEDDRVITTSWGPQRQVEGFSGSFVLYNDDGSVDDSFIGLHDYFEGVERDHEGNLVSIWVVEPRILAEFSDGRLLVSLPGYDQSYLLARLHYDGTFDESFSGGTIFGGPPEERIRNVRDPEHDNERISVPAFFPTWHGFTDAKILADGHILVSGQFFEYDGHFSPGLVRLDPNGNIDYSFSPGGGARHLESDDRAARVDSITVDWRGRIYLTGLFDEFNDALVSSLVRLHDDGSVDTAFFPELTSHFLFESFADLHLDGNGRIFLLGQYRKDTDIWPYGLHVLTTNLAPVLDNSGAPFLTAIDEDEDPMENPGTSVAELLARLAPNGSATDPDGDPLGIAIVEDFEDNAFLQFDVEATGDWRGFGRQFEHRALLLGPDSLIRFRPSEDFNGTVDPVIAFRIWDQSEGLPGDRRADTTVNGGESAFSVDIDTASIAVQPVQDAPKAEVNKWLVLNDDDEIVIDRSKLSFFDPDDDVTALEITYTLTSLPLQGTLKLGGAALNINDTFSQEDINNGLLSFASIPGAAGIDMFNFQVSASSGIPSDQMFGVGFGLPLQVKKLLAGDGADGDQFGFSVAISGDTAVVGSRLRDSNGFIDSGAAYIFERNIGGTDSWGETAILLPGDPADSQNFGDHVDIDGDTIVVGASRDPEAGTQAGAAYVFQRDAGDLTSWHASTKLQSADLAEEDRFGFSVSLRGDTIAVGSPRNDDADVDAGSAYIFERPGGGDNTWSEAAKLLPSASLSNGTFGNSVALSEDELTVVVGQPRRADGLASPGFAYVFGRNGGADAWGEAALLSPTDGVDLDLFGIDVAISGETIAVGSPLSDPKGESSGSVYLYERNAGNPDQWDFLAKLVSCPIIKLN